MDLVAKAEEFFAKWTNKVFLREMIAIYKEKGQKAYNEAGGTAIGYLPFVFDYVLSPEFLVEK
jgi:hypothetical protein